MIDKKKERWLFCCTSGMIRSPTAARMFENEDCDTMFIGLEYNGIWKVKEQLDGHISWATKIFVMEDEQETFLLSLFPDLEIFNLNVLDTYECDSPALKEILQERMRNCGVEEKYPKEMLEEAMKGKSAPYVPLKVLESKRDLCDWTDRMDALVIPLLRFPSPTYAAYMNLMRELEKFLLKRDLI